MPVTLDSVRAARERIRAHLYLSPAPHSAALSEMTGQHIFLKLDNLQSTGAFKERGALNKHRSPSTRRRAQPWSHRRQRRQSCPGRRLSRQPARHPRAHRMPLTTPLVKGRRPRRTTARKSILHGANYDEACAEAIRRSTEDGLTFLHPFDDDAVIAGQGTIGLELLEQIPDLEAVVVPIGGGGLIGGIACAIKESNPKIRVVGVQTDRLPSMLRARAAGHPVTIPPTATIADGIAVRRAGDETLPLVEKYVDEIVTVDEEEIASAILAPAGTGKNHGGRRRSRGPGRTAPAQRLPSMANRTAVLVCGGNIDVTLLVPHHRARPG